MKQSIGVASAAALTLALTVVSAQTPPAVTREVLQRQDISVAGREALTAKAVVPANGGTTGRHTHPGEEISYVLEGSIRLEVDGQPAKTLKAGDVFLIPANAIHNATNATATNATIIANYIVEKGKPLATPAK